MSVLSQPFMRGLVLNAAIYYFLSSIFCFQYLQCVYGGIVALILCLVSLSLSIRKRSFRMRVDADKTVKDFYYYNLGSLL